ncbi:MAG: N-acetyl-gamma-glutamyl-phosphate reductase, partial [Alphaproteobacteria bacterium]
MSTKIRLGILGASGYTGADAIRLSLAHPAIEITTLTANAHAGKSVAEVFPHLAFAELPRLTKVEETDWSSLDAVISGLPHATSQTIIRDVLERTPAIKFID